CHNRCTTRRPRAGRCHRRQARTGGPRGHGPLRTRPDATCRVGVHDSLHGADRRAGIAPTARWEMTTTLIRPSRRLVATGPPGRPPIGSLRDMRQDAARGFVRARERYGDIVHSHLASRPIFLICHPNEIKYVLVENARNYTKGRGLEKAKPLLGNGLLTSGGELCLRPRRLAQPAFRRGHTASLAERMPAVTDGILRRCE